MIKSPQQCNLYIYARISSKNNYSKYSNFGSISLDFQIENCKKYANKHKIEVLESNIYTDIGAGATSGFISFAAYGGPRFGVFGTIIMSTVGFGGHYVGEKIIFAKDEFVKARRKHLKRSEIIKK